MTETVVPLVVRRTIEASRERLFSAFTNSQTLTCWFTPSPNISVEALKYEFEPGGRFHLRYEMPDGRKPCVAGVFKEIEPARLIVMTWEWQAPDPLENVPMMVTFRFLEAGDATEIVVVHEGIPSDQACTIHAEGWEGALTILGNLIRQETEQ